MSKTDVSGLSQLGQSVAAPTNPEEAVLERVPNGNAGTDYVVRFTAPEFTSLCPMTGQPDFAHIVIDYIPGDWLVESKSLKLYLTSFRNHGGFHEGTTIDLRLAGSVSLSRASPTCSRSYLPVTIPSRSTAPDATKWIAAGQVSV